MSLRKPLSLKQKEALKHELTRLTKTEKEPEITRVVNQTPIRRIVGPDGDEMTIRHHGRPFHPDSKHVPKE